MTIQTRTISYNHNGVELEGLFAWDDAKEGARPAVAISHAWGGRSPFEEDRAVAVAELGYVGFALDLYGKGVLGSGPEENTALMTPLLADRALLQERINLAVSVLREQDEVDSDRVAAMGYCFGGLCVLDLARSGSDVLGVASFHGLFAPPEDVPNQPITASVLCLHGYDDPMVEPQAVIDLATEMTAAGADWQIHAYGNTQHAFTNPEANDPDMGTIYDARAERRSWQALKDFLAELF